MLHIYSRNKISSILMLTNQVFLATQWRASGLHGFMRVTSSWGFWIVEVEIDSNTELMRKPPLFWTFLPTVFSTYSINKPKSPLPKNKAKQNVNKTSSEVSLQVWLNLSLIKRTSKLLYWEFSSVSISPPFSHQGILVLSMTLHHSSP